MAEYLDLQMGQCKCAYIHYNIMANTSGCLLLHYYIHTSSKALAPCNIFHTIFHCDDCHIIHSRGSKATNMTSTCSRFQIGAVINHSTITLNGKIFTIFVWMKPLYVQR